MDDWKPNIMTPFDCRVANQALQITKLLIPYLPSNTQRTMAVYVKFIEFQNTMSSFHAFKQKAHSTMDIFEELRPYIPPPACDSIDNIMNMLNMMELFQEFQNQSDDSEGRSPFGNMGAFGGMDEFDPMSMMMGMLNPEQQEMFEMYNSMFASEMSGLGNETSKTNGGETHD